MSCSTAAPLRARVSRVFLPLMVLLTAFLVLTATKPAQAQQTIVERARVPFSYELFNYATGEDVRIEGQVIVLSKTTLNKDGSRSFSTMYNIHGKGVGQESGNEYVFNQIQEDSGESAPGVSSGSFNLRAQLISQGSADNVYFLTRISSRLD